LVYACRTRVRDRQYIVKIALLASIMVMVEAKFDIVGVDF